MHGERWGHRQPPPGRGWTLRPLSAQPLEDPDASSDDDRAVVLGDNFSPFEPLNARACVPADLYPDFLGDAAAMQRGHPQLPYHWQEQVESQQQDPDDGSAPPFLELPPVVVDDNPASEGEVHYPSDDGAGLLQAMQQHYQKLQQQMPEYTSRVTFDEFGVRYIEQIQREEAARMRAWESHEALRAADAARADGGASAHRRTGGITTRLVQTWVPLLTQAIAAEQAQVLAAKRRDGKKDRANYGPYLLLVPAEDLAAMTIQTVLSRVSITIADESRDSGTEAESGSVPAVMLADALGRAANDRVKYLRFKHRIHQEQKARGRQATAGRGSGGAAAAAPGVELVVGPSTAGKMAAWQADAAKVGSAYERGHAALAALVAKAGVGRASRRAAEAALTNAKWDSDTRLKVGAALLALLVENTPVPAQGGAARRRPGAGALAPPVGATGFAAAGAGAAPATVPGFDYAYVRLGVKHQAVLRASAPLVELMAKDRGLVASLLSKSPPMLVPPLPWETYNKGGYLTMRCWLMKTRWSYHVKEALRQRAGEYRPVVDALNVLGATPWRINRRVYDVMHALYVDEKSTVAGLPRQVKLPLPRAPPTGFRLVSDGGALHARGGALTRSEKRANTLAKDAVRRDNRNMASIKADFEIRFKVATEYRDAPEFYYPHTLDFRGRAYPIHPSLHHMAGDACRGLLTFARPAKLGPHGLDWLYVHVANVWGHGQDKLAFDERRRFTRRHLPQILECAQQPLANPWWQGAEKPWQCLAACFEVAGALSSLHPEEYESCLPVHMDGSCNGLQHYAALGRDEVGGRAVNLLPSKAPQDVYKGVAQLVAERVEADADNGVVQALRVRGAVDRKLVKQTVMTSVYGVTPIGARLQIEARLKEKKAAVAADEEQLFMASRYLTGLTLDALGEMFGGARQIMAWLAECARLVAAAEQPVRWCSPLGLPIAQPYHKPSTFCVTTVAQNFSVMREDGDRTARVTKSRQRSAFPPNYIHSIDSSHMMRTALACGAANITFAGVHDSFWTHAGSVSDMNRVLRDEFVTLHTSGDLLEDLRRQLQQQHPSIEFPPVPPRGRLAVEAVRNSRYFFS